MLTFFSFFFFTFLTRLGGSLPILIAYFSEFIPRPQRVKFLCALLACWAFGGIYVALMAWAILPKTGRIFGFCWAEHRRDYNEREKIIYRHGFGEPAAETRLKL